MIIDNNIVDRYTPCIEPKSYEISYSYVLLLFLNRFLICLILDFNVGLVDVKLDFDLKHDPTKKSTSIHQRTCLEV